MNNFNGLTPAETERLALLAEECGETIQVIGKILRHGYNSHSPFDPEATPNRELLQKELGDIDRAVKIMAVNHDVSGEKIAQRSSQKQEAVAKYLHHQSRI